MPASRHALHLRATGQVVRFDGFLKLYQEGRDDEVGRRVRPSAANAEGRKSDQEEDRRSQHFTEPPPRFTEATLVKQMEELGIGRPSTYASTLAVLKDRDYVRLDKKRLFPEDKGRLVTAFLESFFTRYVGYDFTADLEEKLDRVSNGEIDWKQVLRDFWTDFSSALAGTKDLRTTQVLDSLNELSGPHIFPAKEDGSNPRACPSCENGMLSLKLGKFGAFIGCSNYPDCKFTRTLNADAAEQSGVKILGIDPESGEEITLRDGRFGAYVQQGEAENGEKPKRTSVPKTMVLDELTLEDAIGLLSLPREVAKHPESKEPIVAGIGRFGPYVQHGKTYANIGKDENILQIGGNRAIDLIVAKESGLSGRRFGGEAQAASRELGQHPEGGKVVIKGGRFGPYVNWGKINATLPRDADPTTLTLEAAIALLAAKASGGGGSRGGRVLGKHPDGGEIAVHSGQFGPYVSYGKVNATLRDDLSPETITLEEAIRLVDAKGPPSKKKAAAKGGKAPAKKAAAKKAAPAKKAAASKAAPTAPAPKVAAKKAPAKKTPAKKTPAKAAAKKAAPAKTTATKKAKSA